MRRRKVTQACTSVGSPFISRTHLVFPRKARLPTDAVRWCAASARMGRLTNAGKMASASGKMQMAVASPVAATGSFCSTVATTANPLTTGFGLACSFAPFTGLLLLAKMTCSTVFAGVFPRWLAVGTLTDGPLQTWTGLKGKALPFC